MTIDIPVQPPMFRILPAGLQNNKEISVTAVLFTQGINEQQSIADTYVVCVYMTMYHLISYFTLCADFLTVIYKNR